MIAYPFVIEIGFDKFPILVIEHVVLHPEDEMDGYLSKTWEHIAKILTYNKVGKDIVIYKKTNSGGIPILQFKAKDFYSKVVDETKSIFLEIQAFSVDYAEKIVEKIFIHCIIDMNEENPNHQLTFMEKPRFCIKTSGGKYLSFCKRGKENVASS